MTCYRPGARSRFFYRARIPHRAARASAAPCPKLTTPALVTAAHTPGSPRPVILCWDNLNTHVSGLMRAFHLTHQDWLTVVQLQAYAPDLNGVRRVAAAL